MRLRRHDQIPGTRAYSSSVTRVPFGEQVLVPGPEVSRVGCHGRAALAPQSPVPGGEGRVGDRDSNCPGDLRGQVAAPDVADLVLTVPVLGGGDRPDAAVGP